ncbi:MAG: ribosome hibernation-promoting factor, HPF/YfiA family [Armatimonadota bacterium]
MQIIFSGKHVEVTPALKQYAESKLSKLSRFFDGVQEVHVMESTLRNQHIVEVTLKANGTMIRAEERSADMYSSIDLVVDKLERQLRRYKERFLTRTRESLGGHKPQETIPSPVPAEAPGEEEGDDEENVSRIVRTKRFAVKPMDPEEAAMEMEMIGHDFYVFRNAENDEVNVVYRRRDGNYGLIEPVVD